MEDFYDFVDEVGEEEEVPNIRQQRLPKRYIRNVFDPFEYHHNEYLTAVQLEFVLNKGL
jgi:hypothetical protein